MSWSVPNSRSHCPGAMKKTQYSRQERWPTFHVIGKALHKFCVCRRRAMRSQVKASFFYIKKVISFSSWYGGAARGCRIGRVTIMMMWLRQQDLRRWASPCAGPQLPWTRLDWLSWRWGFSYFWLGCNQQLCTNDSCSSLWPSTSVSTAGPFDRGEL